jgi:tetratricopeptide (TPR) repeat protein
MILNVPIREDLSHRLSSLGFRRSAVLLGLVGAAGLGKSFTARAVLGALPVRHLVLNANADSGTQAQAWGKLLGGQVRKLPQWARSSLQRWSQGHDLALTDLIQMLVACVRTAGPLVLLLEDWHDVNLAQSESWQAVLNALRDLPACAVIVTSRNVLPSGLEVLRLEPLSELDSAALLEVALSETESGSGVLPVAMQFWIWERSRGNPLFALEYLRDLRRSGHVWFDSQAWVWREPPFNQRPVTLEALIERILDRVSQPQAQRLLDARALLGRYDDLEFWRVVTGLSDSEFVAAQLELEQLGVLADQDFSHPLFLEVARSRSQPGVCRQIAALACGHLEDRDPIRAAEVAVLAGFSADRTLPFFLRAIDRLESIPVRAALLRAQACEFASGELQVRLALEAARVLIHADVRRVDRLTDLVLRQEPLQLEALGLRARALARPDESSSGQSGSGQSGFGQSGSGQSSSIDPAAQLDRAKMVLERVAESDRDLDWWRWHALMLLEAQEYTPLQALILAHPERRLEDDAEIAVGLGQALLKLGSSAQALELFEACLERDHDSVGRSRLQTARGALLTVLGRWDEAEAQLLEVQGTASADTPIQVLFNLKYNLGRVAHKLQRPDQAARFYGRSAEIALELGDQRRYMWAQNSLGGLFFDRANFEAAERALLEGRSLALLSAPTPDLVLHDGWLSDLYTIWGPPHGAALSLKYAHSGLRLARQLEDLDSMFRILHCVVCAEAVHGDARAAWRFVEELSGLPCDPDDEYIVYQSRGVALNALGQKAEAIAAYGQALILIGSSPERAIIAAQTGLELDLVRNDLESARQRLEVFRGLKFHLGVVLTQQYFPELIETNDQRDQIESNHKLLEPGRPKSDLAGAVRLELLGPIRLLRAGQVIAVRGAKRKLLLALLLESQLAGQPETRTIDLCDALYPNTAEADARAAIKQLVFQVRSQIGPEALQTTTDGYRLRNVQSDAQDFLETGETGLWRGPYLMDIAGIEEHGLESVREAMYAQLQRRAANLLTVQAEESARLARILLQVEPFDTNALALALRALQAQGNYVSISRMYKRSRLTWLEVGERLPERWLDFLDAAEVA